MVMQQSEFRTLADYLRPGLKVVSVGLNPSLPSIREGYYFANPRNRFWKAVQCSGLIDEHSQPGAECMRLMFERGMGFTDLVKRPSRMGHELRAADFQRDVPLLRQKLHEAAPEWVWFHGKIAYRYYLKYAENNCPSLLQWGAQPQTIGVSRVYLTPNPSPANAAYSLQALVDWYRALKELADL